MNLVGIIENLPQTPISDLDTFHDNRTKAHLLYREGEERMDVLITPFGDALKGKKDITTYVRFLPNGDAISLVWSDATIDEVVVNGGSRYFALRNNDGKYCVLPFCTREKVMPYKIMPNSFAKSMADCNEQMLTRLSGLFEWLYDLSHDDIVLRKKLRRSMSEEGITSTYKSAVGFLRSEWQSICNMYTALRAPLMAAFKGVQSPSEKLPFFSRKVQHYFVKDVEKYCTRPLTKESFVRSMMRSFFLNPAKHAVFSSEENKIFCFSMSEKRAKELKALLDYVKGENPKAYVVLKELFRDQNKNAAQTYHRYLGLASLASLVVGNYAGCAGFFGAYVLEKHVSQQNAASSGCYTGVIGTLRDKLGLTRKVYSPFEVVSEDYDLGLWNQDDLE